MNLGIKNRVAIVTGGATGIGFAVASNLALEGANVIISSRNNESLIKSIKKLKSINT